MVKKKAILELNNMEYEILRCSYAFTREINAKGQPITGVRGGNIWVQLESDEESVILCQMLLQTIPPIEGHISLLGGEDEQCIRCIKFEKAYIYNYSELLQIYSDSPSLIPILISPVRLDIDDNVHVDRRWPETTGFYWQEYKKEEIKRVEKGTERKEADKLPIITKIYWKDTKGKEILNLPDKGIATICVETENTKEGDTVQFDVVLTDGNTINVFGIVDNKGFVEIPNINLGFKSK